MDERRQWNCRIPDSTGETQWLSIAVPRGAGNVVLHVNGVRLVLSPALLARVVGIFMSAQILAMQDRRS